MRSFKSLAGVLASALCGIATSGPSQPRHEFVAELHDTSETRRREAARRLFALGSAALLAHRSMADAITDAGARTVVRQAQPGRNPDESGLTLHATRRWHTRLLELAGRAPDPAARRAALLLIEPTYEDLPEQVVAELASGVEGRDTGVVRAAIPFAFELVHRRSTLSEKRRAAIPLFALLDASDAATRLFVATQSDLLPRCPRVVGLLRREFTTADADSRSEILAAMVHHGGQSVIPDLIRAMADPALAARFVAQLCQWGRHDAVLALATQPEGITDEALHGAIAWLARHCESELRRAIRTLPAPRAIRALGHCSTRGRANQLLRERVVNALSHPTVSVRAAALRALACDGYSPLRATIWDNPTAQAALGACFISPDPEVRFVACNAAYTLSRRLEPEFAAPLLDRCTDVDPRVRLAAATTLISFAIPRELLNSAVLRTLRESRGRGVAPLLSALQELQPDDRPDVPAWLLVRLIRGPEECVAVGAVALADESMLESLVMLACDRSVAGRVRAAIVARIDELPDATAMTLLRLHPALEGVAQDRANDRLTRRLRRATPTERSAIVRCIDTSRPVTMDLDSMTNAARNRLLRALPLRYAVRLAAASEELATGYGVIRERLRAATLREAAAALHPLLLHASASVRSRAIYYAAQFADTDHAMPLEWLRRALADPEAEVRRVAIWSLPLYGPRAIAWLRLMVVHGSRSDRAQAMAMIAERTPADSDVGPFLEMLRSRSASLRWASVRWVHRARVRDGRVRLRLAEMVGADDDPEVRLAAALAIADDEDVDIRRAVATMLQRDAEPVLRGLASAIMPPVSR